LVDLLEEGFEATVFGEPCSDLRKEFFGDVDRASLAVFFESEVLSLVQRTTVVAATSGPAAAVGVGTEGGSEDRRLGGELLEAMLKHTENESRVVGDTHGVSGTRVWKLLGV
jgi:hypothetical protein